MNRYYDRQGAPLAADEWMARFRDAEYKRVAYDQIGESVISTVWVGLDHQPLPGGPPLIFSTLVVLDAFAADAETFYSTEREALAGHAAIVENLRARQN